jgi:hypothetical protein
MEIEELGRVGVPSGELGLYDVGLAGSLPAERLATWMVIAGGVPRDRALRVIGARLGRGRFAACWDWVAIECGDGEVATSDPLGEATVDFARLLWIDRRGVDAWEHERSLDGKADFVFWGRDAEALAAAIDAPAIDEGHGWIDLEIAECITRCTRAEELKVARGWRLATDFRPHSHHYLALAQVRATPTESGTIDVGGAPACLFATSWGDGVFPVFADRDAAGALVRVRVQLATAASEEAMESVNPL